MSIASPNASNSANQAALNAIAQARQANSAAAVNPFASNGAQSNFFALLSSTQTTTITTTVTSEVVSSAAVGATAAGSDADSADALLSFLQDVTANLTSNTINTGAGTASNCNNASSTSSASSTPATSTTGLSGDYQTLYSEAEAAFQDGQPLDVTLRSGETLSGKFTYEEIEPAGDDALFTPGDPNAPDAGKTAFNNELQSFLGLSELDSQSSSALGQSAQFNTSTSFQGDNIAISWTGSFSLTPPAAATQTQTQGATPA